MNQSADPQALIKKSDALVGRVITFQILQTLVQNSDFVWKVPLTFKL
jgi:hypothetical protein